MGRYSSGIAGAIRGAAVRVLLPLLLAAWMTPGVARELSESDYFADLPVVLSVTRLAQPLNETPGAVTVIDAETIRRSGAREVAEVLALVPGFLVTRRNGGSTVAAYHSALDVYGARMQVYVDGRSVYSSYYFGDTHRGLAAVELASIERIEVLRGSNSAAFGSNAFLGVVNIITRAPADTHGVALSVAGGNQGIDDHSARIGWGSAAGDMRVSASRRSTSGFDSVYDDSHRSELQFRGDFHISPADELSVKLGVARESFGEGLPPIPCNTLAGPGTCDENKQRTDSWRNGFARFDWSRSLGERSMLRIAGGMDQELYLSSFVAQQFPNAVPVVISAPFDVSGKALRQNLEVQRTDVWRADLRSVVGGEILREQVRSPTLFSTTASVSATQWRIFGTIEWKPAPNWVVNAGGTWEKHSLAGSLFAPRLAVNYHLSPEHTVRAATTQSFLMPPLYLLRGEASLPLSRTLRVPPYTTTPLGVLPYAVGTGGVRPESVIANELGYLGDLRGLGLKIDVRAFDERINRRVTVVPPYAFNRPGPDIHGIEYQFDWRPVADTRVVLSEAQLREESGDTATEHVEAPHRTGSLALYQRLPGGFDVSLIGRYATVYRWPGGDLLSLRELDARLAYGFRIGATRGELALAAQSLGNRHLEYVRRQSFAPRIFTSLRLEY